MTPLKSPKLAVDAKAVETRADASNRDYFPLTSLLGYAKKKGRVWSAGETGPFNEQSLDPIDLAWKLSVSRPQPYIALLRNVSVMSGTKVIVSRDGQALGDELEQAFRQFGLRPKLWDMDIAPGPILGLPHYERHKQRIGAAVHLTAEHEANYFHWVVEVLPRLHLYENIATEMTAPIVVSEGLHENLYQLLEFVRSEQRQVLRLAKGLWYEIEQLVYPADVTRILDVYDRAPGYDTTYIPVGLVRAMVHHIKSRVPFQEDRSSQRLYLRRNGSYRRLLNEDEVEDALRVEGFVPVDAAGLSVEQQIKTFHAADLVVGPSGAALTNMVWCRPGTRLVILHSDHPFKKYPYWDALSRVSSSEIQYMAGPRANNVAGFFQAHDDFTIDVSNLRRIV